MVGVSQLFYEIDIGADRGIHIGDKMDIWRGNSYRGRIAIQTVRTSRSVGKNISYKGGLIATGDRAVLVSTIEDRNS